MNIRLRWLAILLLCLAWLLRFTQVRARPLDRPPAQAGTAAPEPSALSAADLIEAINTLRLKHGLSVLEAHPVLMKVAELQARALAASQGAVEHKRPCGITLGQQLLSMGFPLRGDLTLDGYRSENWVMANSAQGAITFWLGDAPHTNTMLSPNRSHIGAASAVSDAMYIVLETAWSTDSDEMQRGADVILTRLPATQSACLGMSDQSGEGFWDLMQYFAPGERSTPHPNGDVIHEVRSGQTLWSLAIDYDTTVAEIKRLNDLTSDAVVPGSRLLIARGVDPSVSSVTPESTRAWVDRDISTPTPWLSYAPTLTAAPPATTGQFSKQGRVIIVTFVISFSVLLAAILGLGRKSKPE